MYAMDVGNPAAVFFEKYLYNADYAHREYIEKLHKARQGIDLTKEELIELDELITPLVKRGQSLTHIYAEHGEEIPCCERTLYTYISNGYLTARNLDMKRTVRYKRRKRKEEQVRTSPLKKANHHYRDFQKELQADPSVRVVEMDTVEGTKGGKVLQTLFWREEKLMLAFLLESKEMSETVQVIDLLEDRLGKELFAELFPVILTDNGSEFADPELFEYGKDGTKRARLYYCQPRHSEQKGGLERNHEYIRYICPKGTSFDELTQEKVDLILDHINSAVRPSLKGASPIKLAIQHFGKETVDKLGLHVIEADDVCLTPELIK